MPNLATAFSPQVRAKEAAHAMLLVEESTRPRIVTSFPSPPVYQVDTGLRAGIKLSFTPDARDEFPSGVAAAISEILKFERLPAGWDSYGAQPLSDGAVVAAFELIVWAE